tara:strand:+ start:804 stop:923 length:120 start_codon:yes stop_codon:yes gene_type:complete
MALNKRLTLPGKEFKKTERQAGGAVLQHKRIKVLYKYLT